VEFCNSHPRTPPVTTRQKRCRRLKITVIVATGAAVLGTCSAVHGQSASVFVYPETSYVETGDTFGLTIEVDSNAVELKGFDIVLSFEGESLDLLCANEGTLMKQGGTTFWHHEADSNAVEMICAILGTGLSVNGPGVLAVISFQASTADRSDLVFEEVNLRNVNKHPIPCESRGGVVWVSGVYVWEEAAIRNLNSLKPELRIFPNPLDVKHIWNTESRAVARWCS